MDVIGASDNPYPLEPLLNKDILLYDASLSSLFWDGPYLI